MIIKRFKDLRYNLNYYVIITDISNAYNCNDNFGSKIIFKKYEIERTYKIDWILLKIFHSH